MKENNVLLINYLSSLGASLVGFADLSSIDLSIRKSFNYGISFAIALDKSIFPINNTKPYMKYYGEFRAVSEKLNTMCEATALFISNLGFDAFPQSRKNNKQDSNWNTVLPHKTIANLSGIGWIGKSALLVNERYGSAIRLSSILTNIPLATENKIIESKCGSCIACKEACPANAIKGNIWSIGINRNDLIDPNNCKQMVINRGKDLGLSEGTCGICIFECPFTKAYSNRAE
jgi:epoxyqueuosine reductase QueG